MKRIAVVDDDQEFLDYLTTILNEAGYSVSGHSSAGGFLDSLAGPPPDLAVLDLQLPGVSGWELIRIVKEHETTRATPIMAVSGVFSQSAHAVRALGIGADEFMTKPVKADVFLAQVGALLRRTSASPGPSPDELLAIEEVEVSVAEHVARVSGEPVHLTPLEFDLLVHLMRNKNRVLTRGLILQQVWKSEPSQTTRTVDKRVEALRKKLGAFGKRIHTVSGVGYCLRI